MLEGVVGIYLTPFSLANFFFKIPTPFLESIVIEVALSYKFKINNNVGKA